MINMYKPVQSVYKLTASGKTNVLCNTAQSVSKLASYVSLGKMATGLMEKGNMKFPVWHYLFLKQMQTVSQRTIDKPK